MRAHSAALSFAFGSTGRASTGVVGLSGRASTRVGGGFFGTGLVSGSTLGRVAVATGGVSREGNVAGATVAVEGALGVGV